MTKVKEEPATLQTFVYPHLNRVVEAVNQEEANTIINNS